MVKSKMRRRKRIKRNKKKKATQRGIKRNRSKIFSTVKVEMMFTGKCKELQDYTQLYKFHAHSNFMIVIITE